jgi:CDP-glycerol glycerophosphotransferase
MRKFIYRLFGLLWWVIDFVYPKFNSYWAFSTHHILSSRLIENQRAIYESVKSRGDIKKIIFYRGEFVNDIEDPVNTEFIELGTLRAFWMILRCKVVFLGHSISMDYSIRWKSGFYVVKLNMKKRLVVNLWHGIPIKRLLQLANANTRAHTDRVSYRRYERSHYTGLVASSDVDAYAMATMFYPIKFEIIWITGLPRNDFLTCDFVKLPLYIKNSMCQIRQHVGKKKLVVYAPTYRQTTVSGDAFYYQFTDEEINKLKEVLIRNDAVLGFRPHYFKNSRNSFNMERYFDGESIIDFSQNIIPEFSALVRECDVLISDYSSVFLDALFLSKKRLCFAYDLTNYLSQQDGLLYPSSMMYDQSPCQTFDDLLSSLQHALNSLTERNDSKEELLRDIYFKYTDDQNSLRVINNIENILDK